MKRPISAFADSRKFFRYYLDCETPLSYESWVKLPDEHKAAALFVQFYSEILSAWNHCYYSSAFQDDNAVSVVLQYLQKNVNKIANDRNRYTCEYIYTVAYNCLVEYSKLSGKKCEKVKSEKSSVSLDECLASDEEFCGDVSIELEIRKREFWRHISLVCTEDELVLIECLINKSHLPVGVGMSRTELKESLQNKLQGFSDFLNN